MTSEKEPSNKKNKDRPWIMRTYAGHTNARESNELFRKNLAKGQTGLSIAFDLPTQTGYDSDHPLAIAEVGKVGVPICNIEDMDMMFEGIPLEEMNTSMTINATAPWLLALYIAVAEKKGLDISALRGTTQNDIIKEYLSRGTYIYPPEPSTGLITDMITYTYEKLPRWNPVNICSYHLQEAGATPVQEIAFSLSNAITVLDSVKDSGRVNNDDFPGVVGRISFFVNAGIRIVEEICKIRAFAELWNEITGERYGVTEDRYKRFRYGVQVNSLGLTVQQPENNVARIILEMLDVTLSKSVRARAVQLPAWNEALGLPRPWDQQWSLRFQQILAYETDILEYEDIFSGSEVIEMKVQQIKNEVKQEIIKIEQMGGTLKSIEYMKSSLVRSNSERIRSVENGDTKIVGVNCFADSENSPLTRDISKSVQKVDPSFVREQISRLSDYRQRRNNHEVQQALKDLESALINNENIMPVSVKCAHAGVTTGEWADTLRNIYGEYRAPTGTAIHITDDLKKTNEVRKRVTSLTSDLGRPVRILVAKPGLDGHSNGAEQIAVRARDLGMEVIYQGIRLRPEQIVATAEQEDVDLVGISILSGSHDILLPEIMKMMKERGLSDIPVIAGGIIPEEDIETLLNSGISRIYTTGRSTINEIMSDISDLVRKKMALDQ